MSPPQTVLLLGATGRTGGRVLTQLLGRGLKVRAIVRSAGRLPPGAAADPNLAVVEADLLALDDAALQRHLAGCGAVVSCLGHVLSVKGILGPPYDLVTRATARLCRAVEALRPDRPVAFILLSSVSVNDPQRPDRRRRGLERAFLGLLRGLLPPARDNQRAVDFLSRTVGTAHRYLRWTAVRPDTLLAGDATAYTVQDALVDSLFAPGHSRMANVARFMADLVADPALQEAWSGRLPVLVDTGPPPPAPEDRC